MYILHEPVQWSREILMERIDGLLLLLMIFVEDSAKA